MKKTRILFDTDIGGDCDDAGALALLHVLCNRGEAELLAVTACYASPYVAGCIDAINTYYGRRVPVGVLHRRSFDTEGVYAAPICRRYPNAYPPGTEVEDSVRVIRRTLAAAEDASVTFVVTGMLSSAADLLKSGPDDISPLSGSELAARKIARTVIMAGRFAATWPAPEETECNIINDVPAAQKVCAEWPGELVFSSYEIGEYIITLREFEQKAPSRNPAAESYRVHHERGRGRESWDLTAMLEAIRPEGGYWYRHDPGTISVDDAGITRFRTHPDGKHTYLLVRRDYEDVRREIDVLIREGY